jgi:CBS domain-containing protein
MDTTVSTVMREDVPTVSLADAASTAADRLRASAAPAVVVQASADPVAGLVTETDVVAVLADRRTDPPVSEVMTSPVPTTNPAERLGGAAAVLREATVDAVPVVETDRVVGLLTSEAVDAVLERLGVDWEGAPVTVPAGEPLSPTTTTAALSVLADRRTE